MSVVKLLLIVAVALASPSLFVVAASASASPSPATSGLTWVVATDWDDTVKAGGNDRFFGIRGVGRRIKGTYPGVTTLLAELDECGSTDLISSLSKSQQNKQSFQVWSANPFSNKKPSSCVPPLHRKPVTRRGSLVAGCQWVAANSVPRRFGAVRQWALERGATALGDVKLGAFRRAAKSAPPGAEIIFVGDSAQGDAYAARKMIEDAKDGERAWVFLHDLTREVTPCQEPLFEDERIAIRNPFRGKQHSDAWKSPRLHYYKTTPEAAFLLAQNGFLTRDSLRRIVDATCRETIDCPFQVDEATIARLRAQDRECCAYSELIRRDVAKCEQLLGCDRFWREASRKGVVRCTEELAKPCRVPSMVCRSEEAARRAEKAAAFREAAEAEWRRELRK